MATAAEGTSWEKQAFIGGKELYERLLTTTTKQVPTRTPFQSNNAKSGEDKHESPTKWHILQMMRDDNEPKQMARSRSEIIKEENDKKLFFNENMPKSKS